ncbi:glycerophosphodiester phosphodiesterase [Thalassotalea aquiviva]|uniref:glycerophosphodiester phosphodiesterase n=1 Tax=Thalassotalea aquiviva TaxID=3242415 RepID=UPI00352B68D0
MRIFAHRGASGYEPENTLLAIKKALHMKVDAIEIDVHLCDGQLVLIHDHWVDKTTNGHGRVSQMSFTQLRLLDAGKNCQIPTLNEALELIAGQCSVNIELKSAGTVELTLQAMQHAINHYGFSQQQFIVSSFDHHLIKHLKQLAPSYQIGALTASCPIDYAAFASALNAYSVHVDFDVISQAFVEDAHQRGLKVYVYTCDRQEDLIHLAKLKVDGVFANYPDQAKAILLAAK